MLDYAGYCEAIEFLGVQNLSKLSLIESFNFAFGILADRAKSYEAMDQKTSIPEDEEKIGSGRKQAFLNYNQFKLAWLSLVNLTAELVRRGISTTNLTRKKKKGLLLQYIDGMEVAYFRVLDQVNDIVGNIKTDRRMKKDAAKREMEAFRLQIQHDAQKFIGEI